MTRDQTYCIGEHDKVIFHKNVYFLIVTNVMLQTRYWSYYAS